MMMKYPEVPMLWYGGIIVVSFAMAMATCYANHSQLPWWALIVALLYVHPFYCPPVRPERALTRLQTRGGHFPLCPRRREYRELPLPLSSY